MKNIRGKCWFGLKYGWKRKTGGKLKRSCQKDRRCREKEQERKSNEGMIMGDKKELAEQGEKEEMKEEWIIKGRIIE